MMSYPWHRSFPNPWNENNDLCYLFTYTACKTWWDLRDSQMLDISISEESITDMLLLEMLRRTNRIACKKFTRPAENKSGADWQWWFVSGNQGFPMLIQAKRLYPCGRYKALNYKKGNRYDQTNTLLRTARNDGFLPLFCFYNYWNSKTHLPNPNYGCALASAQFVKDHLRYIGPKENCIDRIKPISVPWSSLVCPIDRSGINFPDAVRRRVMQIHGISPKSVPAVRSLPQEVRQILRKARMEDDQRQSEVMRSFSEKSKPLENGTSLAGINVVSDQPFERKG